MLPRIYVIHPGVSFRKRHSLNWNLIQHFGSCTAPACYVSVSTDAVPGRARVETAHRAKLTLRVRPYDTPAGTRQPHVQLSRMQLRCVRHRSRRVEGAPTHEFATVWLLHDALHYRTSWSILNASFHICFVSDHWFFAEFLVSGNPMYSSCCRECTFDLNPKNWRCINSRVHHPVIVTQHTYSTLRN